MPNTLSNEALTEIEIFSQEVLDSLINDNLSPTPSNFSLYFDRLLENKNDEIKNQILSMLELDEIDDESSVELEQSLKQGFLSVKNILGITANLYKNMLLMTKILEKRKKELTLSNTSRVLTMLEADVSKLHTIVEKQSIHMKTVYEETAAIVKEVEKETKFDTVYGVYNKRYLLIRLEREIESIKKFKYTSSLIFIELSKDLKSSVKNEKALALMTKTVARILLKTSRRSDIVAHYGNGRFAMLLKHTDIENAKRASSRLVDLVSNSNFFLGDQEIQLKISIGITDIDATHSVEETVVAAMDGIIKSYEDKTQDYAVMLKDGMKSTI